MEACTILKSARLRLGYTQTNIAGIIGCSQSAISRIEHFHIKSDMVTFLKLLRFLDVKISVSDPGSKNHIEM